MTDESPATPARAGAENTPTAEHRRHSRVVPRLPVIVSADRLSPRRGTIHDVSYTGLFVDIDTEGIECGSCTVEIPLEEAGRSISIQGEILRVSRDGIAIQKNVVIGEEGFHDFLNLIAYNSADVARIEEEIRRPAG